MGLVTQEIMPQLWLSMNMDPTNMNDSTVHFQVRTCNSFLIYHK